MKHYTIALALIAALLLAGCSSSEPAAETTAAPTAPAGYEQLPEWTYIDQSTQDVHFAAAYSKMSDRQNSIKRAQAEARNLIAEWVNTAVDEIITTYTNDAGSGSNRQAVDAFETLSKQRAQAILSGVKQENMHIDSEGGVWVLMSIPVENVASQMYGAASEAVEQAGFERNEAAEEANNLMNAAIDKYFGNPSVTE